MKHLRILLAALLLLISLAPALGQQSPAAAQADRIRQLEAENKELRDDLLRMREDLDEYKVQTNCNLSLFHGDVNTMMTWVGIIAAFLIAVVTLVTILIPYISNKRFEEKMEGWKENVLKRMTDLENKAAESQKEAAESQKRASVSQLLTEANRYLGEKDYEKAISLCDQAIEKDSQSADAFFLRALTYQTRGEQNSSTSDLNQAIEDYGKAIEKNPNYAEAYYNRGIAKSDLDDKEGAIEDYGKAIEKNPNLAAAYNNRGIAKSALGDKNRAIEDYGKAIELNPNNAEAYNNLANVYLDEKFEGYDLDRAMEFVETAIELSKGQNGCIIDTRGEIWMKKGELEKALDDFNKAEVLWPNEAEVYEHRSLCYRKMAEQETNTDKNQELLAKAEADKKEAERLKKK